MNASSKRLPCPRVILPLELELFATTLATVAGLAFSEGSRSASVAFR